MCLARVAAARRHSWLGCWGVCVFVCALHLYPATPGWGVRCGCVCLGSGCGYAAPLLAGVLGCVCPCVRAPLVPRHSWPGCAVWVCVLGLGFRLRAASSGWGVGVCVCLCLRSACIPRLLAGVCGVGVCAWAWASAAPRHSWLGCWGVCAFVCAFRLVPCPSWLGRRCGGVCLGLGFSCALPLLAGVLGCVCVCVRAPLVPRHSWLGCAVLVCGVGFRLLSAFFWVGCWGVWPLACAASVSRHLLVGLPVPWGCAGVAVGGVCPPPSPFIFFLFGLRGGGLWFSALSCRGFVVSAAACPGLGSLGLRPPFASRLGCAYVFLVFLPAIAPVGCVSACPGCPFLRWAAALGWVPPVLARRSSGVLSGGPVGAVFGAVWLGGLPASCEVGARLRGCVPVSCPPPFFFAVCLFPPLFFSGGGVCLFLPLPSLGWCTHWSAFGVVNRVAVGACGLVGRAPAPWVGWVMYTLGPVAFPVGLGSGSAGWAVAPGGFGRPWVRGAGAFRVLPPLWCGL